LETVIEMTTLSWRSEGFWLEAKVTDVFWTICSAVVGEVLGLSRVSPE
jgi:hypothetical protein